MAKKDIQFEIMDDQMAEVMRSKSGAERLQIAWGMWKSAREMLIANLRRNHPNWTEAQVERETARRMSHGAI